MSDLATNTTLHIHVRLVVSDILHIIGVDFHVIVYFRFLTASGSEIPLKFLTRERKQTPLVCATMKKQSQFKTHESQY